MMTNDTKCLFLLTLIVVLGLWRNDPARAAEDETPSLTGSGIGVAAGILPPPGVYGSLQTAHSGLTVKNDEGAGLPAKITSNSLDMGVLWVPTFTLFGASYGIGLFQPLRQQSLTTPHVNEDVSGLANTILNLSTLSWNLGKGFHLSAGADLFIDDVSYSKNKPINVGHDFVTLEPRTALTYVGDVWTLTGSLLFNVNTKNSANQYLSGNTMVFDFTALRRIDRWQIGLGSEMLQQISDDRRNGIVVPAVLNGHGRGNRARDLSLGPIVGYDFAKFDVQGYYKHSVTSANVAGGYEVGLRVNFPLYTSGPVSGTELSAVAKR